MLASLSLLGLSLVAAQQAGAEAAPAAKVMTQVEKAKAQTESAVLEAADSKMAGRDGKTKRSGRPLVLKTQRAGRPAVLERSKDLSKLRLPGRSAPAPAVASVAQAPAAGPVAPGAGHPVTPPAATAPTGPIGELVIPAEQASQDFGVLREGSIARTEISLMNTGEGDLVISAARATCGCTQSEIFLVGEGGELEPYVMDTPIPPGAAFQVNVGVDSTRKKGPWTGSVSLFSNDPVQPDVISLKAQVQQMFEISPTAFMNFESVRVGTEKESQLTVSSPILDAFSLRVDEQVFTHTPWLEVDLTPIEPDADGRAKTWTITGRLTSDAPEQQRWNGPINLITDVPLAGDQLDEAGQPKMHEVTMTAMAQIQGLVTANPFYLSMGIVPPGQRVERSFTLEIHDPEFRPGTVPVTVEGRVEKEVELWKEHASATATVLEDGNFQVTLVIENLPDTMAGPFGGTVQVAVGHPTKDVVSVPFSGVCRNSISAPQTRPAVAPPVKQGE